jgi:NADH/NAD ratio-sensing transcriptional regulator Rex
VAVRVVKKLRRASQAMKYENSERLAREISVDASDVRRSFGLEECGVALPTARISR